MSNLKRKFEEEEQNLKKRKLNLKKCGDEECYACENFEDVSCYGEECGNEYCDNQCDGFKKWKDEMISECKSRLGKIENEKLKNENEELKSDLIYCLKKLKTEMKNNMEKRKICECNIHSNYRKSFK